MTAGAPLSPRFWSAMSQGVCILVHCLAGNTRFVTDHN
jgi:hypothetical protein